MPTSLITKKRIAKAFKSSYPKNPLIKSQLSTSCRKQGFVVKPLQPFLDKYELLDWIFETELQEQVTDNLTYISGIKLLDELLYYIESNQSFYRQLFEIKGQNDFVSYLEGYFMVLMEKIINEYQLQEGKMISQQDKHF